MASAAFATAANAADTQTSPVIAARIAAATVIIDHHAPAQARMMRCVAATNARHGELAVTDWRDQIRRADEVLEKAGITALQRLSLLARVAPEVLLAAKGSEAEERAACAANEGSWQERWSLLMFATFAADLREALTGTR